MLKNRGISIQIHRAEPSANSETQESTSFETKMKIFQEFTKDVAKTVALGIVGYVLLDTFRQVQIQKAKNPLD